MAVLTLLVAGFSSYLVGALLLGVYRLCFHPLARFPGPKLTAATHWYEFYYDIFKKPGGQFMFEINRMHERYGPIVRINPDEIHVQDSSWVDVLYVNSRYDIRDKHVPAANMAGTSLGTFGTISHDIHRKRRSAVTPFFSKSSVIASESIIHDKATLLCEQLRSQILRNGFAEMRTNCLSMTTDVVCQTVFGRCWNLLQHEEKARDWKKTINALAGNTPLVKQYNWIIPLSMKLPLFVVQALAPDLAWVVAMRRDFRREAQRTIDLYQSRSLAEHPSEKRATDLPPMFRAILESKDLPNDDKYAERLAQEASIVVSAGGETTARVLTNATFYVLSNRDRVLKPLMEELRQIPIENGKRPKFLDLEKLPWLTAIVKESLRITGPITSRLPVVSPEKPLLYKDWTIPAKTATSVSLRDILFDPSIFKNPNEFQPERWLAGKSEVDHLSKGFLPFSRGSRGCLGKDLALVELYITLFYVFRSLDLQLYETTYERDVAIVRDCFVGETSLGSEGVRVTFNR